MFWTLKVIRGHQLLQFFIGPFHSSSLGWVIWKKVIVRGKFAVSDLKISELRAAAPDRNDTPSKKIKNTIKYKNLPCSIEAPSAKWRSSHSRPALLVVQREAQSLSEAAERRLAPSAAARPAERQIASGLQLHATHRWPLSAIDFRREPWCGQIWIVRVESGVCVFFFLYFIFQTWECAADVHWALWWGNLGSNEGRNGGGMSWYTRLSPTSS